MCNSTVMSPLYGSDTVLCSVEIKLWIIGKNFSMKATHSRDRLDNSPIFPECQSESAKVLAPPREKAHQDDSNDTQKLSF